jgi:hypothetical protein
MSGWDRFTPEKKAAIEKKAKEIFARLDANAL